MVKSDDPIFVPAGRGEMFEGEEDEVWSDAPIVRHLGEAGVFGRMNDEMVIRTHTFQSLLEIPKDVRGNLDGVVGLHQETVVDVDSLCLGADQFADAGDEIENTARHVNVEERFDGVRRRKLDRQLGGAETMFHMMEETLREARQQRMPSEEVFNVPLQLF